MINAVAAGIITNVKTAAMYLLTTFGILLRKEAIPAYKSQKECCATLPRRESVPIRQKPISPLSLDWNTLEEMVLKWKQVFQLIPLVTT
jgi:hypothetical protein